MSHKRFPVKHKVMVHAAPRRVFRGRERIALERNERRCVNGLDRCQVLVAQVRLVRRDFGHVKVPGGLLQERHEVGGIVSFPSAHIDAGDNMRVDSAHQMHLDPLAVVDVSPVLFVVPADEAGRGETARVNGELSLHGFEREAAYGDQVLEDRCHIGIGKVVCDRVEVRSAGDQALRFSVPKVAGKTSGREAGVNLVGRSKEHVCQRECWTASAFVDRLLDTPTEISQQDAKPSLFLGLRCIVSRPVLRVSLARDLGHPDRFSLRNHSVLVSLALHDILDRPQVLALHLAGFMIGARTSEPRYNGVPLAVLGLRRHQPGIILSTYPALSRYLQSSLLPSVHVCFPP